MGVPGMFGQGRRLEQEARQGVAVLEGKAL